MRLGNITLAVIVLLVLTFTISTGVAETNEIASDTAVGITADDATSGNEDVYANIEEYKGPIGPGSALYGLKIAWENFDESFTFDANKKLEKKINHAQLRIAEMKAESKKNNNEAVNKALENYIEKIQDADEHVSRISDGGTGFVLAQEMIKKHQYLLENLNTLHPGNKGLARALDNSKRLESKFTEKLNKARKDREEETDKPLKIKAKIIGNNTSVAVELKFKSESTDNFTIAQEIHDKFQLSVENINALLTVENIDKGELKTELEAEANIEKSFTIVKAEYKFPLLNTDEKTGIISGIHDKLSGLATAEILRVLEIKEKTERKELQEAKKEEKRENKEVKKEEKEVRKEEKRENKEARKDDKATRNED